MIYKNCRRRLGPKAARRHVLSELPPANCANSRGAGIDPMLPVVHGKNQPVHIEQQVLRKDWSQETKGSFEECQNDKNSPF